MRHKLILPLAFAAFVCCSAQILVRTPDGGRHQGEPVSPLIPPGIHLDATYRAGSFIDYSFRFPHQIIGNPDDGGDFVRAVQDSGPNRFDFVTYGKGVWYDSNEHGLHFDGSYLRSRDSEFGLDISESNVTMWAFVKLHAMPAVHTAVAKSDGAVIARIEAQQGHWWFRWWPNEVIKVPAELDVWVLLAMRYNDGLLAAFVDGVKVGEIPAQEIPFGLGDRAFTVGAVTAGPNSLSPKESYWYGWIEQAGLSRQAVSDEQLAGLVAHLHQQH